MVWTYRMVAPQQDAVVVALWTLQALPRLAADHLCLALSPGNRCISARLSDSQDAQTGCPLMLLPGCVHIDVSISRVGAILCPLRSFGAMAGSVQLLEMLVGVVRLKVGVEVLTSAARCRCAVARHYLVYCLAAVVSRQTCRRKIDSVDCFEALLSQKEARTS